MTLANGWQKQTSRTTDDALAKDMFYMLERREKSDHGQ